MDENKAENNTVESGEVSGRPNRSDPIEKTEETAKDQPLSEQKNAPPETAPSEGQNAELQKNSPQESQKPEKKKLAGRKPAPNGQKQIKKGSRDLPEAHLPGGPAVSAQLTSSFLSSSSPGQ